MWEPPEPVNLQWIDKLLGCLFLLRLITLQCLRLMICERTKVDIFDCRISVILASAQRSLAKCRLGPQLLASPPHPHPQKNLPWRPLCDNLLAVFTARYLYTDSTHKVAEIKKKVTSPYKSLPIVDCVVATDNESRVKHIHRIKSIQANRRASRHSRPTVQRSLQNTNAQ